MTTSISALRTVPWWSSLSASARGAWPPSTSVTSAPSGHHKADAQRVVAAFEAEILDVGGARFAHSQSVQAEQHRERGVLTFVLLGSEPQDAELGAVQAAGVRRMELRSAHVLGRVRGDATVDVGEAVEPAHCRQAPVDRPRRQCPLLHPAAIQLDVWTRCRQYDELGIRRPLKEPAEVVTEASRARPL